jgi:dTMP kinase
VVEDQEEAGRVTAGTGRFVVFEGGDAVGKTTQVDLLCYWLQQAGYQVARTFEPGDTEAGRKIREILLSPATGELDPRAEALLYAADKAHHLAVVVRPALAAGVVVVCDRYVDSMLAYQGAGRVLGLDEVERLARWATQDLRPDLTVLLDMDPDGAVSGKADKDRLEAAGDGFHVRVRSYYLELAAHDPGNYLVLNARQPREEIAAQVVERVRPLLAGVPQLSALPGTVTP